MDNPQDPFRWARDIAATLISRVIFDVGPTSAEYQEMYELLAESLAVKEIPPVESLAEDRITTKRTIEQIADPEENPRKRPPITMPSRILILGASPAAENISGTLDANRAIGQIGTIGLTYPTKEFIEYGSPPVIVEVPQECDLPSLEEE